MKVNVEITFKCEMQDFDSLIDNVRKNLQPMITYYNTEARILIAPLVMTATIQKGK